MSAAHGRIRTEELRSRSCRTEEEVAELWQKSRDDRRETSDKNRKCIRFKMGIFQVGPPKIPEKGWLSGPSLTFVISGQ